MPQFEFHVARQARDRYAFDETLFALSGNVIFANFHAARIFAQKMNDQRDLVHFPERAVQAGQLNAMGLIDELLHYVITQYRRQINPAAMQKALDWLNANLGVDAVDGALRKFATEFPNVAVYRGATDPERFLNSVTDGVPHRQIILEEMVMLWLANVNPAFAPFGELFDDTPLKATAYAPILANLYLFFDTQPRFGPDHQNLIDMLRAPALISPHSLEGQLEFIRTRWIALIGEYVARLLGSLDLIREEQKVVFLGPGESPVPMFKGGTYGTFGWSDLEYERFSRDLDWMPRIVLIAKSTYVWLEQLSKEYQRAITRLDQIPDPELDRLARRGFTGLWLIGVWQRSAASKRIKELCGNLNAEASAYSVYDYCIADDLGGDAAMENLKARAWQRGVRVASDMVPNHMGIDSRWVIEHPDWFIASDYAPFPAYTFTGPNLSNDARVGIYIEDHYLSRTDAAVVFKRVDLWTGSTKYIYHGNDGTSFPWNDTAQLNFLNPAVREAVIQTILHVARQFPVIRLDAAMTLAKKHFQRLWFPQPGTGGDIPSRSDFGLTKEQFDEAMPQEFWREVVDRVAVEAPNTLLLAEAFWLMEGYFVRTLGMHRVYNSAFMNMLRDEKNANYRSVIKNTIEFDPEILKRYVNFMNNPDERTAAEQFGTGDKYFGICTLLATMPGLPMFGHGQIEGFTERYGMEFRRAMRDEQVDAHLVERHDHEIFPLLHRRALFAGVENYLLYDFFTPDGTVNEDVFAYSNRVGDERGLVIYHNKYADTAGWIRTSAAFLDKQTGGLVQKNIAEGLGLDAGKDAWVIFRDQASGLEFIRPCQELWDQGLYVALGAYQRHVFLDFRHVRDSAGQPYAELARLLNGRGTPSIEQARQELSLQPIHVPLRELVNADLLRRLLQARAVPGRGRVTKKFQLDTELLDEIETKYLELARQAKRFSGGSGDALALPEQVRRELEAVLQLPLLRTRFPLADARASKWLLAHLADDAAWATLFAWVFVHALGKMQSDVDFAARSTSWIDEWLLGKVIAGVLPDLGLSQTQAWQAITTIKLMTTHQSWHRVRARKQSRAYRVVKAWLDDSETAQFLHINRYNDILWFNQEAYEALTGWSYTMALVLASAASKRKPAQIAQDIDEVYGDLQTLLKAEKQSKYQVEKLVAATANPRASLG